MGLGALYFIVCFALIGTGVFFILKDEGYEPLATINKYMIYYLAGDLLFRYFLQKMPVMNIRPLIILNIKKSTIVHFSLGKTVLSFFNWTHAFFFLPFTIVLLMEGYGYQAIFWHMAMFSLIYLNNFINLLINNKDVVFYSVLAVFAGLGLTQYYNLFDITSYTQPFFQGMYNTVYLFLLPILLLIGTYYFSFNYFKSYLNLDEGLAKKSDVAQTENYTWLNQFGTLGTFLKNDIRLLRRNKRSKMTLFMSILFVFYGLLFFGNAIEAYNNPAMKVFAGIFVSGGFLFTFGQFIPSWDSAYYQLMMSQNI
jgi:hypothetical protein